MSNQYQLNLHQGKNKKLKINALDGTQNDDRSATNEYVIEAFKIILLDKKVKAVLVNIFGGIVRCDLIADGIISAVSEVGANLPVVVRLEGNNAALGTKRLADSRLHIIVATNPTEAAQQVVAVVEGK